jgi:hypothetical protein
MELEELYDRTIYHLKTKGWTKGTLGWIKGGSEASCLGGTMVLILGSAASRYSMDYCLGPVAEVIQRNFNDRITKPVISYPEFRLKLADIIINFNDHPDTNLKDVIDVLEEAKSNLKGT